MLGVNTLLNLNLLREGSLFTYDVPSRFDGKQCVEKENIKISLCYLPSKGKLCLQPIEDSTRGFDHEIKVQCTSLSASIKEPISMKRIVVTDMQ